MGKRKKVVDSARWANMKKTLLEQLDVPGHSLSMSTLAEEQKIKGIYTL